MEEIREKILQGFGFVYLTGGLCLSTGRLKYLKPREGENFMYFNGNFPEKHLEVLLFGARIGHLGEELCHHWPLGLNPH